MKKKIFFISLIILLSTINFALAVGVGERMQGRILLQVENSGEAWYVEPGSNKRYYLGRPEDALRVMRQVGVGISNADLMRIPLASANFEGDDIDSDGLPDVLEDALGTDKENADCDSDGFTDGDEVKKGYEPLKSGKLPIDNAFAARQSGKILLQVEAHGEAWYIDPVSLERYLLGGPETAMKIMRQLGTGITNTDLEQIESDSAQPEDNPVIMKALNFINNNLMQPGNEVTLKTYSDQGFVYKIIFSMSSGQETTSYVSKDGKLFFPQVMDMDEITQKKNKEKTVNSQPAEIPGLVASAKPSVELFVMSHCPYGTQMEKGILPVLDTLGDKIDFELKFVNYAMHGKTEIDEQINQYCIQKLENNKFLDYLECFLADGDSVTCIEKIEIDQSTLTTCISETDAAFSITEKFNDKSTWKSGRFPEFPIYDAESTAYGVSGSPTLVINGTKVTTSRSSTALLTIICSAFSEAPSECETELSDVTPSAGFGYSGSGGDTNAECG